MRVYISFPGFYETFIDPAHVIENMREWDKENYDCSDKALADYWEECDSAFRPDLYKEEVGKVWVSNYESTLDSLGVKVPSLSFAAIRSPREYNFVTDSCECEISAADLVKVFEYALSIQRDNDSSREEYSGEKIDGFYTFADYVAKQLRPRDGFIPYYSQDLADWGPVTEWECAQTEILFDFVLNEQDIWNEYGPAEDLVCECEEAAAANNPDFDGFLTEYNEREARKENGTKAVFAFFGHKDLEIMARETFEARYLTGDQTIDGYIREYHAHGPADCVLTGDKGAALNHAVFLSQCGYIDTVTHDQWAARIAAAPESFEAVNPEADAPREFIGEDGEGTH